MIISNSRTETKSGFRTSSNIGYWIRLWRHTTLIMLFSSKVPCVSVAISIASTSTALFSKRFLRTNSSLQTIAAAPPSDVGLRKEESSANRLKGVAKSFLHSNKLAQSSKTKFSDIRARCNWETNSQKLFRGDIYCFINTSFVFNDHVRRERSFVSWIDLLFLMTTWES